MNNSLTRVLGAVALALLLAACQQSETPAGDAAAGAADEAAGEAASAATDSAPVINAADQSLAAILAAQPAEVQARYMYRHPAETLEFFGIEPGMTVMEVLPSGGWYTKILVPYLGEDGTLVGVDYDKALFPMFGFMSAEALEAKETWPEDWVAEAAGWFEGPTADIEAFQFGSLPERFEGEMDAVLMIRALHNMARFESRGGFLTAAIADTVRALKPGGIVGVVQHMAPEDAPDAWANGDAGYLKKSAVIEKFAAAGLELVAESSINENPLDQPTTDDIVWRLPPTLMGSRDDPQAAEAVRAIGESNRMTLLFRKPE